MKITVKKEIIGKKMLNNYDYITKFNETLICVLKDDKYGFINKEGKEVVRPIYNWADDFSEGLACVEKDGKYGFINKDGEEVVKPIYDWAADFSKGLARVKKDGYWGLINKEGKEIIKPVYDDVSNFYEGLVHVKRDDSCYIIDLKNPTYEISVDLQDKTMKWQFSNESKVDEFLNAVNSYIEKRSQIKNDEETEVNKFFESLKKQYEKDSIEINNSYIDDVENEFNNCYKKSMN